MGIELWLIVWMSKSASIVWFRRDLRVADNPAIDAAIRRGGPVIPVFIWAPEEEEPWSPGSASRWWLHQSLAQLAGALERIGARLLVRRGPSLETLESLACESDADAVFWNRCYEPAVLERDRWVQDRFRAAGRTAESFNGSLLFDPWSIQNKGGKAFRVFTPFWKSCLRCAAPPEPSMAPKRVPALSRPLKSLPLRHLELEPRMDWAGRFREVWEPGEIGAAKALRHFCAKAFADYSVDRDRPSRSGTSRLSPHLHFGEISLRQIWHFLRRHAGKMALGENAWMNSQFMTELGWREFAHHLLFHFPHTPERPLRNEFARFPWRSNAKRLKAWQLGRTGYPLVDAGMRQLWTTGWMHNRVRMVVASFLVKDLLLPWQAGAEWFWDTLVDADLASNTLGWQWSAGCGADAAPFFRIFNPVTQGEKFDPDGSYIRQWVPEIARLSDEWIHKPWLAPKVALAGVGVKIGETYPAPIVDHVTARKKALEAYAKIRVTGL